MTDEFLAEVRKDFDDARHGVEMASIDTSAMTGEERIQLRPKLQRIYRVANMREEDS